MGSASNGKEVLSRDPGQHADCPVALRTAPAPDAHASGSLPGIRAVPLDATLALFRQGTLLSMGIENGTRPSGPRGGSRATGAGAGALARRGLMTSASSALVRHPPHSRPWDEWPWTGPCVRDRQREAGRPSPSRSTVVSPTRGAGNLSCRPSGHTTSADSMPMLAARPK